MDITDHTNHSTTIPENSHGITSQTMTLANVPTDATELPWEKDSQKTLSPKAKRKAARKRASRSRKRNRR